MAGVGTHLPQGQHSSPLSCFLISYFVRVVFMLFLVSILGIFLVFTKLKGREKPLPCLLSRVQTAVRQ